MELDFRDGTLAFQLARLEPSERAAAREEMRAAGMGANDIARAFKQASALRELIDHVTDHKVQALIACERVCVGCFTKARIPPDGAGPPGWRIVDWKPGTEPPSSAPPAGRYFCCSTACMHKAFPSTQRHSRKATPLVGPCSPRDARDAAEQEAIEPTDHNLYDYCPVAYNGNDKLVCTRPVHDAGDHVVGKDGRIICRWPIDPERD